VKMLVAAVIVAGLIVLIAVVRAKGYNPIPGVPTTDTGTTDVPEAAPVTTTETSVVVRTVPDRQARKHVRDLTRRLHVEHRRLLAARHSVVLFRHRVVSLTHTLHTDGSTSEAINLACTIYGNCSLLWRRAMCESGGYAYAKNPSSDASGLYQFMPSTFRSTPFGSFSIWSPYASALAAGWMQSHGRGGEWVCR